jgi:hypothetical protein
MRYDMTNPALTDDTHSPALACDDKTFEGFDPAYACDLRDDLALAEMLTSDEFLYGCEA